VSSFLMGKVDKGKIDSPRSAHFIIRCAVVVNYVPGGNFTTCLKRRRKMTNEEIIAAIIVAINSNGRHAGRWTFHNGAISNRARTIFITPLTGCVQTYAPGGYTHCVVSAGTEIEVAIQQLANSLFPRPTFPTWEQREMMS
jgi:hypothetical protein